MIEAALLVVLNNMERGGTHPLNSSSGKRCYSSVRLCEGFGGRYNAVRVERGTHYA